MFPLTLGAGGAKRLERSPFCGLSRESLDLRPASLAGILKRLEGKFEFPELEIEQGPCRWFEMEVAAWDGRNPC
jgi:hypothetical protein